MKRVLQILILLFLLPPYTLTAANPTLEDGLVAYYPFSGNANEATGSGPNGTVIGATLTEDRFGNSNSAYLFDGINDYINLGNTLNFPSWDTYSVSLWFLNDGGGDASSRGYGQKILSKGKFFSDFHLLLRQEPDNHLSWWSDQGGFVSVVDTTTDYRDKAWHHVVLNMFYINANQRRGEMWVDGKLKVSGTLWKVTNSVDLIFGFTAHTDGFQRQYWSGKIDDTRIYNRTLTNTEINELYLKDQSANSEYIDLTQLLDINGNNFPETASLRRLANGHPQVVIKDSNTGKPINFVGFFGPTWQPKGVDSIDANGDNMPDLAVLAVRETDGRIKVQVRDVRTDALIKQIEFFDANWEARNLTVGDADYNGMPDISVLAVNKTNGNVAVEIRDAATGNKIRRVWLPK